MILLGLKIFLEGCLLTMSCLEQKHRDLLGRLGWKQVFLVLALPRLLHLVKEVSDCSQTDDDVAQLVQSALGLLVLLLGLQQLLRMKHDPLLLALLPRSVQVARG